MVTRAASLEAVEKATASRFPAPCWIATDEPLLMVEFGDLLRARARSLGYPERVPLDIGSGFDGSRLLGEARARSLFGEARLLDLRLAAKPPRGFGEALVELVALAGSDCAVLVSSPRLDRAVSGAAWFGQALAEGLLVEANAPERTELPRWLAGRLARNDQRAAAGTLELIAERTEGNLVAAQQAIDRIALLAPAGMLDPNLVDALVSDDARFDSFALVETALAGRIGRALVMLDGLRREDAPLPLLAWGLADALRRLLRAQEARAAGQAVPSALRAAGIFGRREPAFRQALATLDRAAAQDCLREVARLDRMAKGVDSSALAEDPWALVERILVRLAGLQPLPEAAT